MAVKPTPNNSLYKGFVFDGIDSRDYGVYISGDAVFDSPERDVEMIEIPGRNGSFALDKGRFGNITVSYPAGLFGEDEASFREGIRALRNALASRKGYCRLEDDYNPNEYRMAVYKKGLEVDPALLKAGEFTIEFDCMPQRWLKSGETAVSVENGGTITNPTLFESHPLLIFDSIRGNATISLNGETITFVNREVSNVTVTNSRNISIDEDLDTPYTLDNVDQLNNGDRITLGDSTLSMTVRKPFMADQYRGVLQSVTVTSSEGLRYVSSVQDYHELTMQLAISNNFEFFYRTAKTATYSVTLQMVFKHPESGYSPSTITVNNINISVTMSYDGTNTVNIRYVYTSPNADMIIIPLSVFKVKDTIGYSTKITLSGTIYFDLDIGEAYRYEDGAIVSVNNSVLFPAKLPVLKSGANTITYESTITQVRVVPRWWEV